VKITWLTDAQAPYREPLWRELAVISDFDVAFTFREERVRHWEWRPSADYPSAVVGSWTVPLPGAVARRLDSPMAVLRPGVAAAVLRDADALIIQNWWQPANLWCAWLAARRRIPYMLYAESTLESRRFARGPLAWLRSFIFRNAGAAIVPGPAAAKAALADGTAPHRVVETVNSVDLEQFDRAVRTLRTSDDAVLGPEHRFVYVGQLIERKNVGSLIRAFATVSSKATLDIAGDGVEMPELIALARSLGISDRVRFLGFLEEPEVVRLLARTHTLVLPSTEEVYGFTALEGFVAGLQVIVSEPAGIAPNLAGRNGVWVVTPDDRGIGEALAAAIDTWTGWQQDVDADFASPQRCAADILRAAEIARRP
jgi:glycosyltransferase involved in cell wall biosynthesis